MGIDTSIYQNLLRPVRSVADYDAEAQAQQQNALALRMSRQKMAEFDRGVQEQGVIRNALLGLGGNATDEARINALKGTGLPGGFTQADALQKTLLERQKAAAEVGHKQAQTAGAQLDQQVKALEFQVQKLGGVSDPAQVAAWFGEAVQGGVFKPEQAQAEFQRFQQMMQQPGGFAAWRDSALQTGMSATEQMKAKAEAAKIAETGRHNLAGEGIQIRGQDRQSADNAASRGVQIRGQNLTDARARDKNKIDGEAVSKVEWKQDANGAWVGLPKAVTGNGPVTPFSTTGAGKKELQARNALEVIGEAEKLIDQGTGSYAGAAIDMAGKAVGHATPGAIASGQLKALEGALMMAQPRMEGPQSNMDVQLYRQMAAQIGDSTVPPKIKKAALGTIKSLNEKYAGTAKPPSAAPAAPAAFDADKERRYQEWKAKQGQK